VRLALDLVD